MSFPDDTWQIPELMCCLQTTAASNPWEQEDDHIVELEGDFQGALFPKEALGCWMHNPPIVLKVAHTDTAVKARRK